MTALWFLVAVALPAWGAYALVTAASRSLPRSAAMMGLLEKGDWLRANGNIIKDTHSGKVTVPLLQHGAVALRFFLAAGIGLGWGSCTYVLWLMGFGRPQGMYLAVEALFWFVLTFLFRPDEPSVVPQGERSS